VSSLLEPKSYYKKELVELYEQRWHVELDFRIIKTEIKMLRCQTVAMVDKEIAVNLLTYNLVCASLVHSAEVSKKNRVI